MTKKFGVVTLKREEIVVAFEREEKGFGWKVSINLRRGKGIFVLFNEGN